jgi:hypothetical protein
VGVGAGSEHFSSSFRPETELVVCNLPGRYDHPWPVIYFSLSSGYFVLKGRLLAYIPVLNFRLVKIPTWVRILKTG